MGLYSQPSADDYVTGSFEFFRLKQELSSAGDIFEIPQSGRAFCLGPDSDISRVNIGYVNAIEQTIFGLANATPTNLETFTLTPERALAGFIPARNAERGFSPQSNATVAVPGRILLWPAELWDSLYLPVGFSAGNDILVREDPIIDVFQYFGNPFALQSARSDKTYYYDQLPFGADDCFVMIPYFGRRSAIVTIQNTGADAMTCTLKGLNFRIKDEAVSPFTEFQIDNDVVAAAAIAQQFVIAATNGMFDYLILQFSPGVGGANVVLRVTVSDR